MKINEKALIRPAHKYKRIAGLTRNTMAITGQDSSVLSPKSFAFSLFPPPD